MIQHNVDGEAVNSISGATFAIESAATDETIAVVAAVESSERAFRGEWTKITLSRRGSRRAKRK